MSCNKYFVGSGSSGLGVQSTLWIPKYAKGVQSTLWIPKYAKGVQNAFWTPFLFRNHRVQSQTL